MVANDAMPQANLMIWSRTGNLVASTNLSNRTISISADQESDISIKSLGRSEAFIRCRDGKNTVIFHGEDGEIENVMLKEGLPTQIADHTWLVLKTATEVPTKPQDSNSDSNALYKQIFEWVQQPMNGFAELRLKLNQFMSIVVDNTTAEGGILVLHDNGEFSLAANEGLSTEKAENLWAKMPQNIILDILKNNARIILPENLQRLSDDATTVFISHIKSYVGFPIIAEAKVVGIYFLYFDNILSRLSAELQESLESITSLLGMVIQRAMLRREIENIKLGRNDQSESLPDSRLMVGSSKSLGEIYRLIMRLAPVDVPTLIRGETGTGKELVAKEMHRMSPRAQKPFVVLNAGALPENLIEAELFGYKKGAFTGAIAHRIGLIEQANGGTLFIDEIGELPISLQAKLLRVLQEKAVHRLGENIPRPIDFRLLSATHQDLQAMAKKSEFREDLYYRIAGAEILLPPLRERRQDIISLANYFKQKFIAHHGLTDKEWTSDAIEALESYAWPGNIRELENAVARAFVMSDSSFLASENLNLNFKNSVSKSKVAAATESVTFNEARDQWMKNFLINSLSKHNGKRAETAKALGIGQRTLFRYIEQYGIKEP